MGTKLTYALYLTISQAVLNLLLFFLGFQTEKLAVGQHLQWFALLIHIAILWFALKAIREENPGKSLTYGQGVGNGTLISLISGLMSAVYTYIHFKFINVNFVDFQLEVAREKWAAAGLSDARMEQAEAMMRKFSSPVIYACFTPIMAVIFGVLIALVLSAILKRNPPGDGKVAA